MTNFADFSKTKPIVIDGVTYDGAAFMRAVAFGGETMQDMAEVPSWIAFWGARAADAKLAHDEHEAKYRKARDAFHLAAATVGVPESDDKKITKANAELLWRTTEHYEKWWAELAQFERAWSIAGYVHEACGRKATMLAAMRKQFLEEVHAYSAS